MTTATVQPVTNTSNEKFAWKRWVIIVLLCISAVIGFVDRTNIGIVLTLKEVIKLFNLTNVDRGLLNSAFFWSYAALQIPAGWAVDRWGVKKPYAIGFAFWCVAAACSGLTHNMAQLTFTRVLTGAGEAVVVPATFVWIRNNFEAKDTGLAVGIYMLGTKIGPALAAPVCAYLIIAHNWRVMFSVVGIGGMIWLIPWLFLADDKVRVQQTASKKTLSPKDYPTSLLFKSPVVWGSIITNFCYNYFVFYCMTWLPAYFVESRHLSLGKMGFYAFFSFSGMAIVTVLAGWVADLLIKRGMDGITVRKAFTCAGFAVAATELLGVHASSNNMALFWAVVSLSGLGLAAANQIALTRLALIPAPLVGRLTGIQMVFVALAGIAAPVLSGWLMRKGGGYQLPMQVIWVFLIVGIVATLIFMREKYAPRLKESS